MITKDELGALLTARMAHYPTSALLLVTERRLPSRFRGHARLRIESGVSQLRSCQGLAAILFVVPFDEGTADGFERWVRSTAQPVKIWRVEEPLSVIAHAIEAALRISIPVEAEPEAPPLPTKGSIQGLRESEDEEGEGEFGEISSPMDDEPRTSAADLGSVEESMVRADEQDRHRPHEKRKPVRRRREETEVEAPRKKLGDEPPATIKTQASEEAPPAPAPQQEEILPMLKSSAESVRSKSSASRNGQPEIPLSEWLQSRLKPSGQETAAEAYERLKDDIDSAGYKNPPSSIKQTMRNIWAGRGSKGRATPRPVGPGLVSSPSRPAKARKERRGAQTPAEGTLAEVAGLLRQAQETIGRVPDPAAQLEAKDKEIAALRGRVSELEAEVARFQTGIAALASNPTHNGQHKPARR